MDDVFSTRLRQALHDLVVCPTCGHRRYTVNELANASGIPYSTMRYFMAGHQARLHTVDLLLLFLRKNGIEVSA